MGALAATFQRELKLRLRGGGWASSLGLFIAATGLAPLALGRDPALLAATGPALMWIAACLSLLMGLDGLYEEDLRAGGLATYRLTPQPLALTILMKMMAAWITTCVPLIVASPVILFAFGVETGWVGMAAVAMGTPALAVLAGTIGALCAGLRRGSALIVFLSFPLFAPALVFGPATTGDAPLIPLLVLGVFSLQAIALCPIIAAAALRTHMN